MNIYDDVYSIEFEREGVHADEVFVDGAFCDLYSYGLLEDDWRVDDD
jgi:ribosomal-protein-alanine N-acetyltransferase